MRGGRSDVSGSSTGGGVLSPPEVAAGVRCALAGVALAAWIGRALCLRGLPSGVRKPTVVGGGKASGDVGVRDSLPETGFEVGLGLSSSRFSGEL